MQVYQPKPILRTLLLGANLLVRQPWQPSGTILVSSLSFPFPSLPQHILHWQRQRIGDVSCCCHRPRTIQHSGIISVASSLSLQITGSLVPCPSNQHHRAFGIIGTFNRSVIIPNPLPSTHTCSSFLLVEPGLTANAPLTINCRPFTLLHLSFPSRFSPQKWKEGDATSARPFSTSPLYCRSISSLEICSSNRLAPAWKAHSSQDQQQIFSSPWVTRFKLNATALLVSKTLDRFLPFPCLIGDLLTDHCNQPTANRRLH